MSSRIALVVEDQANFREFLTVALERLGFEVVTAITGKVAMRRLQEHKFKLVLLDVMLPDMDGFAICRELRDREQTSRVPIIFISAVGTDKAYANAMDAGATDYLVKPISLDQLKTTIGQYIDLAK